MTVPWPCGAGCVASIWHVCGLDLESPGAGYGVVLCPGGGMFVWPVIVVCVDCFVGISYATIGLENQVVFACS